MKTEYYRHEYTWSNHCITGNTLGWGIIASSLPKNKGMLQELEKMASALEPDRAGEMAVEELVYSPSCGFVKMIGVPCDAGEDNRKNKRIYLYQPKEKNMDSPDVYLAPAEGWAEPEDRYLPMVETDAMQISVKEILIKMNLYDRLPDFLKVVFLCLFEKRHSLNIVASSWKKEDFAENARQLMFVIHKMIPAPVRKRAGYVSYSEQPLHRVPFYFSETACDENCFYLDSFGKEKGKQSENELEKYFFYHLAEFYVTGDPLYEAFMKTAADYLDGGSGNGNELGKLEWIFYGMCRNANKELLDKQILMPHMPELLFWSSKDAVLKDIAGDIWNDFQHGTWENYEKEEYIRILLEGFTRRTQKVICEQLRWLLQGIFLENPAECQEQLSFIREKNLLVYGLLLSEQYEKKGTFSNELFEAGMQSFDSMSSYVKDLEKAGIPSELKNQIILAGIGLLNENLFEKERYEIFDQIIRQLKREDQWVEILKDFVGQLENQAEELENEQLETACYVEQLLEGYRPEEGKGILMEENRRRRQKELPTETEQDAAMLVPVEEEEGEESFPGFLLGMIPQGFLTGCSLYLSSYSLMIGHWKIALGMAGIWVILMLNYYSMMLYKEKRYPFWKNLGSCVIMGYLIETVGSMILSQKIRLYYFIILGILTVFVQGAGIIRKKLGKEEQ